MGLLLRLAVLCVLLSSGGGTTRAAMVVCAAFLLYLWKTQRIALPVLASRPQQGNRVLTELRDLFLPLLLSLVPSWTVQQYLNNEDQHVLDMLDDEEMDDQAQQI